MFSVEFFFRLHDVSASEPCNPSACSQPFEKSKIQRVNSFILTALLELSRWNFITTVSVKCVQGWRNNVEGAFPPVYILCSGGTSLKLFKDILIMFEAWLSVMI